MAKFDYAEFGRDIAQLARKYIDERLVAIKGELDERFAKTLNLDQRLADLEAKKSESLERRVSRHAEHLARLEDRLRAIETKGNRA